MDSISNNSLSTYLQNPLESQLHASGAAASSTSVSSPNANATPASASDVGQLSALAELVSALQNLLETNQTQYAEVTGQIASNLLKAAQVAQAAGDSVTADRLELLAGAFTSTSQSGQSSQFQYPDLNLSSITFGASSSADSIDSKNDKSAAAAAGTFLTGT